MEYALSVKDLRVSFYTRRGVFKALNGVNLELRRGEVLGVAGESGSGKSTTGLAIMGLLPRNAKVSSGSVLFDGRDLLAPLTSIRKFSTGRNESAIRKLHRELAPIRGKRISMVFQEPMTSLNPVLQVGYQIAETLVIHNPSLLASRKLARVRATREDTTALLKVIKENEGSETAVREFVESRHLKGLEEQALFIWRRNDINELRKERLILDLCCEKVGSTTKRLLESLEGGMGITKAPVLSRLLRRVLFKEGYRKAVEFLSTLGVPNPEKVVQMYPHELSGGMRQRIVIAIALINNPDVVIMDEPTSAVDVTVQAQILELVKDLKRRVNSSFIFISHDLSVLGEVSDRIAIMYGGRVVEVGPKEIVLKAPRHPYTTMLINAIPTLDGREIRGIEGEAPDMRNPPPGCIFNNRCPFAMDKCRKEEPPSYKVSEDHYVACFLQGGK